MAVSGSGVTREKRLLGMIMTLLYYPHGLTKNELFACLEGYSEKFNSLRPSETDQGLERQFSRDKSELRRLGIPIETVSEYEALNDNQATRYVIRESEYEFPKDILFSAQELSLIERAADAWREGSMGRESRHALTKLRSLGLPADESRVGVSLSFNTSGDVFERVQEAIDESKSIDFSYLKPDSSTPEQRKVLPLALLFRFNQWHMYSFDLTREDFRTFLISRIISVPRLGSVVEFSQSGKDFAQILASEVNRLYSENVAIVEADLNSDAFVRLRSMFGEPWDDGAFRINFSDLALLADQLSEFGHMIRASSPASLQSELDARFARIYDAHSGGAE